MIKNLSAVQETQVQSLSREDPLEKGMTTHLENSMDRVMSIIASQAMLRITIMNVGGSRSLTGTIAVVPRDKVGTYTRVAVVKVEREMLDDRYSWETELTQYIHGLGMEFEIKKS